MESLRRGLRFRSFFFHRRYVRPLRNRCFVRRSHLSPKDKELCAARSVRYLCRCSLDLAQTCNATSESLCADMYAKECCFPELAWTVDITGVKPCVVTQDQFLDALMSRSRRIASTIRRKRRTEPPCQYFATTSRSMPESGGTQT